MASIIVQRINLVTVQATQANSTAAHTTALGPFNISNSPFSGLWLFYLSVHFGVPAAAINEDVLLQDISNNTVMSWHTNMATGAAAPPQWIIFNPGMPGLVASTIVANQQTWNLVTPATVNGPGYSVNMIAYLV